LKKKKHSENFISHPPGENITNLSTDTQLSAFSNLPKPFCMNVIHSYQIKSICTPLTIYPTRLVSYEKIEGEEARQRALNMRTILL